MRTHTGIFISSVSALSLTICAGQVLSAQTSAAAAEATAPPATAAVTMAGQDSANDLSVAVGKSVLVDFEQPIKRAAVGLSDIADAVATSPTELMVNGKTPGQTSLIVWVKGGDRQFFNITVRRNIYESTDRLDAVRRELAVSLPGQPIKVSSENGSIFLRGSVKDLDSSDRAAAIAATALAPIGNSDTTGKTAVGSSSGSTGKVVNLLYVDVPAAEKQILLKVRFASVDRTKAKQLGINIYSLGLGNTIGGISSGQTTQATFTGSGSTAAATITTPGNIQIQSPGNLAGGINLNALETSGVTEVLAEPNLVAANGQQASFLAGGEYPFPVVQGNGGGISIQWKEYGVRLNFIPTITPRGTIRLQVSPEVSALDFADAVQVSGYEVPALTVRRVKTEAELSAGQSFVIGGLLDNRETETFEKIPFLGSVPVLGKFFQSIQKSHTNTELIVIVTPEFVDPIPTGETLPELKYPTKFLPSNSNISLHEPDDKPAGASPAALPASLPVEKLIESQKPETPLVVEPGSSK